MKWGSLVVGLIVTLPGRDGNAFAILGRCRAAALDSGLSDDKTAVFMDEAMACDYDQLLQTAMCWIEIR